MSESEVRVLVEHGGVKLVVEEDIEAAFAYLWGLEGMLADVWLYNVGVTPTTLPWKEGRRPPCANPFADDVETARRAPRLEGIGGDLNCDAAGFVVFDKHGKLGFLREGDKPGLAALAAKSGPLAHAWKDGEE
ncbi:MAG: hypothetical protein AAFR03_12640 [Pseudomonadota bacterium]